MVHVDRVDALGGEDCGTSLGPFLDLAQSGGIDQADAATTQVEQRPVVGGAQPQAGEHLRGELLHDPDRRLARAGVLEIQ